LISFKTTQKACFHRGQTGNNPSYYKHDMNYRERVRAVFGMKQGYIRNSSLGVLKEITCAHQGYLFEKTL